MESIVHFIMSNGTMVVTTLLGGIIFCVFGLLIMSFHSPKLAIAQELGSIDRLEGVLRQMLSDQKERPRESAGNASIDDGQISLLKEQITALENDVKEKQKQIDAAESGAGGESTQGEEAVGLKAKVEELEARLAEYSIIEEDISDLSKYRQENEELRKRLDQISGMPSSEALAMPWEEFEKVVKDKKTKSAKDDVSTSINEAE